MISTDIDRLGQLRPGDVIPFHRVRLDEARGADQVMRRDRQALLKRVATAATDT